MYLLHVAREWVLLYSDCVLYFGCGNATLVSLVNENGINCDRRLSLVISKKISKGYVDAIDISLRYASVLVPHRLCSSW